MGQWQIDSLSSLIAGRNCLREFHIPQPCCKTSPVYLLCTTDGTNELFLYPPCSLLFCWNLDLLQLASCSPKGFRRIAGSQASQKTRKRICATCSVALPPCQTLQYLNFTGVLFYALPFCSSAIFVLETNSDIKLGSNWDRVTAQVSDQTGQSWGLIVNNLKSSAYMWHQHINTRVQDGR